MFNQKVNDFKNILNSIFNPLHSLFYPHQWLKRLWYYRFFNKIEANPLTKKQRQSIILDEKRNLIIAGAGTGKTSTIIGKVGYLIKSNKCKNNEILILAYNRSAATELQERIKKQIGVNVEVGTFHSIGKKILKETNFPSKPSFFLDQQDKFDIFISNILDQSLKETEMKSLYSLYFSEYEVPNKDEHKDFKTFQEYSNWVRNNCLLTLNKDKVKSYGELLIANFLFCNNIDYVYEKEYSPNNLLSIDNLYRPDFYIPSIDAYVEYFGIDEYGNTAPYIDSEQYNSDMNWKLNIHKQGNTKLIKLYYHQNKKNRLLIELKSELKKHGAILRKKTNEEILKKITETKKHEIFLELFKRFLSQFKENQNHLKISELYKKSKDERTKLFIRLFEIIFEKYKNYLNKRKEIDFGDMISHASRLSKNNRFISKWKYILIDEFQDISEGRFQLINSLLTQNDITKLFCVGDDWQAIYRFAGSDHTIMNNFRQMFGPSTIFTLDYTFRFNDMIAHSSNEFISRNPSQIKKSLKTIKFKFKPQIFLHWLEDKSDNNIIDVINHIQKDEDTDRKTLQILTRYNRSKFDQFSYKKISDLWKGKVERQRTIHASKGLEADYSIVVDLNSDKSGFPSSRENDPILNIVLSNPDKFKNSEERRLFYVSMTRAKEQTHFIADPILISEFAEELEKNKIQYKVKIIGNKKENKKCPECIDGKIKETEFIEGSIFSCSNYPLCNYRLAKCFECNTHPIERKISKKGQIFAICQNENCKEEYEVCDKCIEGILVRKNSSKGDFLGCHTYQRTKCSGKKEIVKEN